MQGTTQQHQTDGQVHSPAPLWARFLVLMLPLCLLTACPDNGHVAYGQNLIGPELDFREILPAEWEYIYTEHGLDTDKDGVREWIVVYRFDLTCQADQRGCPITASVYRPESGKPPSIVPRPLLPRGRDYLCECSCKFSMEDVLSKHPGDELVVRDECDKKTTRLSIFRWREEKQDYLPLGHFTGDCITYALDEVKVEESRPSRAQLKICFTYHPHEIERTGEQGEEKQQTYYLSTEGNAPVAPADYEVNPCKGEPEAVVLSPYPEKVVMAFYHHYTDEETIETYFTPEDWHLLECSEPNCGGCARARSEVDHVQVTMLTVVQDCDGMFCRQCGSEEADRPVIQAGIRCHYTDGHVDPEETTLEWSLCREDDTWKMESVRLVSPQ